VPSKETSDTIGRRCSRMECSMRTERISQMLLWFSSDTLAIVEFSRNTKDLLLPKTQQFIATFICSVYNT